MSKCFLYKTCRYFWQSGLWPWLTELILYIPQKSLGMGHVSSKYHSEVQRFNVWGHMPYPYCVIISPNCFFFFFWLKIDVLGQKWSPFASRSTLTYVAIPTLHNIFANQIILILVIIWINEAFTLVWCYYCFILCSFCIQMNVIIYVNIYSTW